MRQFLPDGPTIAELGQVVQGGPVELARQMIPIAKADDLLRHQFLRTLGVSGASIVAGAEVHLKQ